MLYIRIEFCASSSYLHIYKDEREEDIQKKDKFSSLPFIHFCCHRHRQRFEVVTLLTSDREREERKRNKITTSEIKVDFFPE